HIPKLVSSEGKIMSSVFITNREHGVSKPCGCGRKTGPCTCKTEDPCCELDCLTAPRFFCGQLLTDLDMTALVEWTRNKFRLARYRQGWGVVCGLGVHCDPEQKGRLVVTPGYAVSCCGRDIVVCKDATVDLSEYCKPYVDPCAEFKPPNEPTL